jgi:hypothetical protein
MSVHTGYSFSIYLDTMLNAIPDTRNAGDMSEVFLAPNEEIDSERRDEIEREEKLASHDVIDFIARPKSIIGSSKSTSSSSIELPKIYPTADMGKVLF